MTLDNHMFGARRALAHKLQQSYKHCSVSEQTKCTSTVHNFLSFYLMYSSTLIYHIPDVIN